MDTKQEEAFNVAETIRVQANRQKFSMISSSIHLSLSIGLMQGSSSIHEMMRKADIAMYEAKSKGKNMTNIFMDR